MLSTSVSILVRTVIELVANETPYNKMYSRFFGPVDFAIKATCKNYTSSEMYEVTALCSILKCNIRSIYQNIDMREEKTWKF